LESPTKASKKPVTLFIDDDCKLESEDINPDTEETELEQLRKNYVGEVDLPESMSFFCVLVSVSKTHDRRGTSSKGVTAPFCPFPDTIP